MRKAVSLAGLGVALLVSGPAQSHEFRVYFAPGGTAFADGQPGPGAAWFRQVVEDAACYARLPGITGVRISAHADSVGSPEANLALSRLRGEQLAQMLSRLGVERSRIVIEAHGESRPAVPAGDDQSEVLNRRAVIAHLGAPTSTTGCSGPTLPAVPGQRR
jgi:outer membrane protein OmpA-like peptidoglycan-associated protein